MKKSDSLYEKMWLLATVAKISLVAGIASFVLAFLSTRVNFPALGFVLVGVGLALLFFRDAFRPRPKPENDNGESKGGRDE